MVRGGTTSLLTQANAIACTVTRSIHATFNPKALAPQASNGLGETTEPRRAECRD
jgi:hypothetical protein